MRNKKASVNPSLLKLLTVAAVATASKADGPTINGIYPNFSVSYMQPSTWAGLNCSISGEVDYAAINATGTGYAIGNADAWVPTPIWISQGNSDPKVLSDLVCHSAAKAITHNPSENLQLKIFACFQGNCGPVVSSIGHPIDATPFNQAHSHLRNPDHSPAMEQG
ncbi:MAG: hypothetical protein K0R66_346 [Gammaproteobacteria bacterium]|jgi:hypothetical protein|nr:hypothetical protein [Gammaproteobacteria bacterium]